MDPIRNPYNPGAGIPPPSLVGRDDELQTFDIAVQRLALGRSARSMMLTGLRGVGKTVLLNEFGRIAQSHGWVHQKLEVHTDMPFLEEMVALVRNTLLRFSAGERLKERVRRALGILKAFQIRWNLPEGADVTMGLDPVVGWADSGLLSVDIAGLFVEMGEVSKLNNIGTLFTIDEVQQLEAKEQKASLEACIMGLHRISQEQLPFMIVGAGLPSIPGLLGSIKSYSERLFAYTEINSLNEEQSHSALVDPAEEIGVKWEKDALAKITSETKGYPYFIQEFGKHTWDVAVGPNVIRMEDVEKGIPKATVALDKGFFKSRIERITSAERAYLEAMATLGGGGPVATREVADYMSKGDLKAGGQRKTLIDKGLCYSPRLGWIDFTVPMFDQFIRRIIPDTSMAAAEGE